MGFAKHAKTHLSSTFLQVIGGRLIEKSKGQVVLIYAFPRHEIITLYLLSRLLFFPLELKINVGYVFDRHIFDPHEPIEDTFLVFYFRAKLPRSAPTQPDLSLTAFLVHFWHLPNLLF